MGTMATPARPSSGTAAVTTGGKYLTFVLGREEYGLPVLKVREIIKVMDITHVPQVEAHVLGVINLRGRVIPVIDLRRKFGFAAQEHTERTCIIVAEVELAQAVVMMGVVVDAVSEVVNVGAAEIESAPDFGGHNTTDYILGLAKVKGTVKILLDLDRVLGSDGPLAIRPV
ncbi:MAG TPA: chemotaxis protein CheW [Vicinamibacterales bacterium]|nr:chemotaxis protein CheW [Vicinamibacterales bacterium]